MGRGHSVRIRESGIGAPGAVDWLLYFEGLAYRTRSSAFAPDDCTVARGFSGDPDLVIDLSGDAPGGRAPILHAVFDGIPGEVGVVTALLNRTAPDVRIVRTTAATSPCVVRSARFAVERPETLGPSLDATTARLATLLIDAVESGSAAAAPIVDTVAVRSTSSAVAFGAYALAGRLMTRLAALVQHPDHWRIALRPVEGDGVMERLDWSGAGWRVLPDDARRYFADPFLFAWEGRRWIFCEEFPYATGRGILSTAEIDVAGVAGAPRPVLETDVHLSWPNVFAHDGAVYMIPESAGANRVELWRAVEFPHRWERDSVLLEGVRAHDPQLHLTDRGAFLLATVDGDGGSSWDALGLFHAPGLRGPWQSHPHNPLLVDVTCARAAGPLVSRGGELWRATQDCSTGYGGGLALCRVTRLDADGFSQEVVARPGLPPGLGAEGVHTLSRSGSLEAIDLRGPRRKRPAG